jgi:hypothetical protein
MDADTVSLYLCVGAGFALSTYKDFPPHESFAQLARKIIMSLLAGLAWPVAFVIKMTTDFQ